MLMTAGIGVAQEMTDNSRSDEAGAASDEDGGSRKARHLLAPVAEGGPLNDRATDIRYSP